MAECALTTIDNPFNPFDEFDEWLRFDNDKGYNTCEYLARISINSTEFGDELFDELNEEAIDEIVRMNPNGLYKKVYNSKN